MPTGNILHIEAGVFISYKFQPDIYMSMLCILHKHSFTLESDEFLYPGIYMNSTFIRIIQHTCGITGELNG